jgi:signal transduction histidine kinase
MCEAQIRSPRILVIDDDKTYKKLLLRRLLSFMPSATILDFDDLTTARVALSSDSGSYDLVILDEHLPDGRGVELLKEGWFQDLAVLTISSDTEPETMGRVVGAGAMFFLNKVQIKEPLFEPLVRGLMDRNKIQRVLNETRDQEIRIGTVRTLVATLRHEINNPLGAVLGAAYLMKRSQNASEEQIEAARLVEESGNRIKHVLDELCAAIEIDAVQKANQKVFHIPGDRPWDPGVTPKKDTE